MNEKTPKSIAARAGAWSARNRKKAIFGWLAFVAIAFVLGGALGQKNLSDEDQGTGDSARAEKILDDAFPAGPDEQVLVQARSGEMSFGDKRFTAAVRDVEGVLAGAKGIEKIESPLTKAHADQVSEDRRSAVVNFEISTDDDEAAEKVVEPIEAAIAKVNARHPDMRVEQFGGASAGRALSASFEDDFKKAETLSLPITLVILLLAFGALVAALLPLFLALTSVAAAIGLTAVVSQFMPVDESIASVILLIGMAVGVDYALFYLRREREERQAGRSPLEAIDIAAATSGRAVLVSGLTVLVAMAGMFFTGHATFMSFAVGTMLVVAVAMIGSLTLLPALLSWLGPRVDKGRVPFLGRFRRADGESRAWNAILNVVLGHPKAAAVASTAVLLALAAPALGLKTANSGIEDLPRDLPIMQTYDRLAAAFPGGQIPAVVVVKADDVTAPQARDAITGLRDRAVASGQFERPTALTVSDDRTVASVQLPIVGNGTDERSNAALATLRDEIVPQTVGRLGAAEAHVSGMTAESKDFNDLMKSRAPIVFAFVLSLAFILLLTTFRSIVIAAKAIVLNLLSVAAAYGVLVLVFQHGWGASLLGVDEATQGAITSWLPMFLFVILFGLSMDYHVFILSRIREAFDGGMSTDDAVAHGIKTTASTVTSAAVVMVAVFSIFGTLSFIDMKQMGVGLAAAVLIDATIVRAVLLPAAMKLLGDWNWYLPRWMEWLPRISHEGPAPQRQPARATA